MQYSGRKETTIKLSLTLCSTSHERLSIRRIRMLYELLNIIFGVVLLVYTLDYTLRLRDDKREPRRVSSRIPLIGHVLGIVRYGTVYYNLTR